jgi:hypothetical protein
MKYVFLFASCILFINSRSQELEFIKHFEGTCKSVEINGDFAYFNSGPQINILDIADPDNISLINTFYTDPRAYVMDINYCNDHLFICAGSRGFAIYNVAQPEFPELLCWIKWPLILYAYESIIQDSIMLIDEGEDKNDLSIFNISDVFHPIFCSKLELPYYQANAYELKNNILYTFGPNWSLLVYDISNTFQPELIGDFDLCSSGPWPDDMLVYGESLLVAIDDTVKIYDLSVSDTINYLGQFSVTYPVTRLHHCDDTLYCQCPDFGIASFKLTDLLNPEYLGFYQETLPIDKFISENSLLMTSLGHKGFEIFDIVDFADPQLLYQNKKTDCVDFMEINGNYAYVQMQENGFQIMDVSDPVNPTKLGNLDTITIDRDIDFYQNYLYGTNWNSSKIFIIDVLNPMNPLLVNQLNIYGVIDFQVYKDLLYIKKGGDSLKIFSLDNPVQPVVIASYAVDGGSLAVDSNLLVISFNVPDMPYQSGIKSYKILSDSVITFIDEQMLGDYSEYQSREIEIDYPIIKLGVDGGAVIAKVNPSLHISLCDEYISNGMTYSMKADNEYMYVSGYYEGSGKTFIINIQNPYNISLVITIGGFVSDLALKEYFLFTCESQNGFSVYGDITTNILEPTTTTNKIQTNIYPNPSRSKIIITHQTDSPVTISIYSLNGHQVTEPMFYDQKQMELNLDHLPAGVYLIEIVSSNGIEFKKLILIK